MVLEKVPFYSEYPLDLVSFALENFPTFSPFWPRVANRDATGLNLSSFGLIKLLIFGARSLGPILIVELRALVVELWALTRAFQIIVLNDLKACFGVFMANFLTYFKIFTTLVHWLIFWARISEIYSRTLLVPLYLDSNALWDSSGGDLSDWSQIIYRSDRTQQRSFLDSDNLFSEFSLYLVHADRQS